MHRFFVIGDFGYLQHFSYLDHVTDIMSQISSEEKYDFIATVGDNVYDNGIVDIKKRDDVDKIMSAFKKPALKDLPMYLTLGNHD